MDMDELEEKFSIEGEVGFAELEEDLVLSQYPTSLQIWIFVCMVRI